MHSKKKIQSRSAILLLLVLGCNLQPNPNGPEDRKTVYRKSHSNTQSNLKNWSSKSALRPIGLHAIWYKPYQPKQLHLKLCVIYFVGWCTNSVQSWPPQLWKCFRSYSNFKCGIIHDPLHVNHENLVITKKPPISAHIAIIWCQQILKKWDLCSVVTSCLWVETCVIIIWADIGGFLVTVQHMSNDHISAKMLRSVTSSWKVT